MKKIVIDLATKLCFYLHMKKYTMKSHNNIKTKLLSLILLPTILTCCSQSGSDSEVVNSDPPVSNIISDVDFWLTKANQSARLEKQAVKLQFGTGFNMYPNIEVDPNQSFQSVDGFGYMLTGGSAEVINSLSASKKTELLNELFGNADNAISVSYLRISIGSSDLNATTFSYNDLPQGQTDVNLDNFSLNPDKKDLIPLLKEILKINPTLKLMGSPWSPPVWMKDNNSTIGGSLQPQYYSVYAQYFVKYIQQMKQEGISIDAITPQNEPLHPGNNPSMHMTAEQQIDFIKNHLGPAFKNANITTKIIVYDHNCDKPEYPIAVMNDAVAKSFVAGAAFHLYAGNISALSTVHNAHPDKAVYFTEQWTGAQSSFEADLKWHSENVLIGSLRNWSKTVLEWNLASDSSYGPHTPGGCTQCKGAITVNSSSSFTKNVSYFIIGHASKFVPSGSVRIGSSSVDRLTSVAFKTPAGKKVLLVTNTGSTSELFNIKYNGKWVTTSLDAGSVGTYIW